MSIERTQQISPAALPDIHHEAVKRTGKSAITLTTATTSMPHSSTKVSLGNKIDALKTDESQDMNIERLDSIKAALAAGDLPVDTDKIAESLARDIFQLF